MENNFDVAILGAGAAGMFCAAESARRGCKVILVDHAHKIGEKIRISGGGRCNFTNIYTKAENFLSQNPKFCKSALAGFTPKDFITRVEASGIEWHEKRLGQLFCNDSAQQIVEMLLNDCHVSGVKLMTGTACKEITHNVDVFRLICDEETITAKSLVIATGGKSIPKIGATGFGYQIAQQFDLNIVETRPGLVPLVFDGPIKEFSKNLAGVGIEARVRFEKTMFQEGFLFTHRGLSGPSILQISSYWREGEDVNINFSPVTDIFSFLLEKKKQQGRVSLFIALSELLPKRLIENYFNMIVNMDNQFGGLKLQQNLADWPDKKLRHLAQILHHWSIKPVGSEGYRTAEVTCGGVDTSELNSKTMEARKVPGLFFIGEVVDVTGWLGGYNFQWAWASAMAAARALSRA